MGSTVEVLASILRNPDVHPGLLVEILDISLEPVHRDIIPVNRDETVRTVRRKPNTQGEGRFTPWCSRLQSSLFGCKLSQNPKSIEHRLEQRSSRHHPKKYPSTLEGPSHSSSTKRNQMPPCCTVMPRLAPVISQSAISGPLGQLLTLKKSAFETLEGHLDC